MTCRARLLALNPAHRRAASGVEVDVTREEELVESYQLAATSYGKPWRCCG